MSTGAVIAMSDATVVRCLLCGDEFDSHDHVVNHLTDDHDLVSRLTENVTAEVPAGMSNIDEATQLARALLNEEGADA